MSYASPGDIQSRYDVRRLGELVKDDGTRATPTQLNSDITLQAMLDDASGLIDSAILIGHRYDPADLALMTGTAKAVLVRLCSDLAYGLLVMRRGYSEQEATRLAPGFGLALKMLDRLRTGEMIFNISSAIEAGHAVRTVWSKNITLVSSALRLFGDLDIQVP